MIAYRINKQERLLTLRYSGDVSVAEWQRTLAQAIAEWPDVITYDSVNDFRSPHSLLTGPEVMDFALAVKKMGMQDYPRRAVAIADEKIDFGLARMFELMTEQDRKVDRFTTDSIEKAAAWLGRPEALIQAEIDAFTLAPNT
jgi:hypothetical protein